MTRAVLAVSMAVAVIAVGAGCAPASDSSAVPRFVTGPTGTVTMPVIPLPAAASFDPSVAVVDGFGCDACASGAVTDAPTYFYGRLPLAVVDRLSATEPSATGPSAADPAAADPAAVATSSRRDLGAMFASGYFGGTYLRGTLAGPPATDGQPRAEDRSPFAPLLDAVGATTQAGLDGIVGDLTALASRGSDDAVREASATWAALLALIAGYNRGYLEVALAHPPAGVVVDAASFTCGSLFDCRSTELPLAALDGLADQLRSLNAPPTPAWSTVATVVGAIGEAAVPGGRQVWDGLLSGASFDPAAYRTIIRLSVGFLEVTQAALLSVLAGPTGGDVALARRGLLETAALVTWAGSYFLGLASPLPATALPTLTCR